MPNLDQESLFSMELVVDKLCLTKTTVCRFPSVAFRLLDFPTLVIHHVDLELAEMLRSKITADPYFKLPIKFSEFQDREGNFAVQKGKSCLFKVSPNTLQMHLANAPLYVMIMDTYPCTPKLVGSCSVPLNVVMDELYDEICQQGVAIPLAKGEKGSFEIFTLMGIKIGCIDFSYRLLSLGGALLRHIPDHMVAQIKSQDNQTIQQSSEQFWKACTDPKILSSVQAQNNQQSEADVLHDVGKRLKDSKMQTDETCVGNVGVQTMRQQHRSLLKKSSSTDKIDTDDIITGIVCPPPLYYNSKVDISAAVSLYRKQQAWMQLHNQFAEDNFSDDGTIRQEDKFSDMDELELKHHSTVMSYQSQEKTQRQHSVSKFSPRKASMGQQKFSSQVAQFPILQALMAELLQLNEAPISSASTYSARRMRGSGDQDLRRSPFAGGAQTNRQTPLRNERVIHSSKKTHVSVLANKCLVSKEKQAFAKVSQSELVPGLTHTQRLRLSKCNPKLLKELDAKEKERLAKWKQQREQGKQVRNFDAQRPALESGDRETAQLVEFDKNQYQSYRRPIPTPRSTLATARKRLDSANENPDSMFVEGVPKADDTVISGFATKEQETAFKYHVDKNSKLPGFGETRIILKGNDKAYFGDDQSHVNPVLEGKEPQLTKIVKEYYDTVDRQENTALIGNEPQLQKVVDSYSYDFDKSTEASLDAGFQLCESPNLTKIMDHFSDELEGPEEIPAANNKFASSSVKPENLGYNVRRPIFKSGKTSPSSEIQVLHEAAQSQENLSTSRHTPRAKGKSSQELSELLSSASIGLETFSDAQETLSDEDSGKIKYLETKDIKIAADSKLGYTWT